MPNKERRCVYQNCKGREQPLFSFPDTPERCLLWRQRAGVSHAPTDYEKVCALHFSKDDFVHKKKLKPGVRPEINKKSSEILIKNSDTEERFIMVAPERYKQLLEIEEDYHKSKDEKETAIKERDVAVTKYNDCKQRRRREVAGLQQELQQEKDARAAEKVHLKAIQNSINKLL